MRYGEGDRESTNVEDRRGEGGMFPRGRGIPIPIGRGGLSITSLLIIGVICMMLGINPLELLSDRDGIPGMPEMPRTPPGTRSPTDIPGLPGQPHVEPQNDDMSRFVRPRLQSLARISRDDRAKCSKINGR